ncbi:MAG: CRISPR-associated endonuclease Cas3'' [Deltaproteobacteria bacterium]|nr:CRISPR-associated endonuclease Cas3'' [Deltaproteobacteria bacterium]
MNGVPATFWGKLSQDARGDVIAWHPLVDHCADVAAVAEALLAIKLWRIRIANLSGLDDLDETICARLCVLSALHDLGKLNTHFQAKGRPDLGFAKGGHVEPGIGALNDAQIQGCLKPLTCFGDRAFGLLVTALAHHGQPKSVDAMAGSHQITPWKPRGGLDPIDGLRCLVAACQRWFPSAFVGGTPLPDSSSLEHSFAGLVTLADWIGSDPVFFPFSSDISDRMEFARRQARQIVSKMSLEVSFDDRADRHARNPFERVSRFTPTAAQKAIVDLPDADSGSITILESETGSGKTEAALANFVGLFARGAVDGLYFALPTRTAATQIFRRVCEAATRAFANPPGVVLAVPGYLQIDDVEGQRLPKFDVLWSR